MVILTRFHCIFICFAELIYLLRETHTDELTGTISKMVENFSDDMGAIAFDLTSTLCKTFLDLVNSEEDYDSKSVTAVGVLETIGCIVAEVDQSEEVCMRKIAGVELPFHPSQSR